MGGEAPRIQPGGRLARVEESRENKRTDFEGSDGDEATTSRGPGHRPSIYSSGHVIKMTMMS